LYLHIPHLIEDKTLKWFSIGILKIVDLIRNKIINAAVFEEVKINFYEIKLFKLNLKKKKPKKEDFHSMDYNFKFANDITEQSCVSSLKIVEDEASKYYRVRKKEREGRNL
jgi:N-alpha-acetyltransferase 35, NatC auxiliary subunit